MKLRKNRKEGMPVLMSSLEKKGMLVCCMRLFALNAVSSFTNMFVLAELELGLVSDHHHF